MRNTLNRPPVLTDNLQIRLRHEDKADIRAAADAAGLTVAEFVRTAALAATRLSINELRSRLAEVVRTGAVQPPLNIPEAIRAGLADPEQRRLMFPLEALRGEVDEGGPQ